MTDERKRKTLTLLLLAAIAIAALASALPRVGLKPGIPLPGQEGNPGPVDLPPTPAITISINTLVLAILGVILSLGLVYCLFRLLQGAPWKAILHSVLILAAFLVGFLVFLFALAMLYALIGIRSTLEPLKIESLPPEVAVAGPPLGPLPPALLWLVAAGLGIVVVLLGVWLIRGQGRKGYPTDPLRLEAERALRALQLDADFKNVIIRCYQQMSLALQKERGIQLEETMTAREFERLLADRGIPEQPVHQLTQLFEAARYGYRQPGPADQQIAIDCLSAIVESSQVGGRSG